MTEEKIISEFNCKSNWNATDPNSTGIVSATSGVDVLAIYYPPTLQANMLTQPLKPLAALEFTKSASGSLIIKGKPISGDPLCNLDLKNLDPKVDKIRVSNGDFTIQEILDHGHDAPFYKQARINLEVQKKAAQGK